jgi:hypothetical protein
MIFSAIYQELGCIFGYFKIVKYSDEAKVIPVTGRGGP